jgi:hypothetical protein
MKPLDPRMATFAEIRTRLEGDRLRVYEALKLHGPCTTRELAKRMDMDILSVRPRVCELCQLFLAAIVAADHGARSCEGVYRALDVCDSMEHHRIRAEELAERQLQLRIPA